MVRIQELNRKDQNRKPPASDDDSSNWQGRATVVIVIGLVSAAVLTILYEVALMCHEIIKDKLNGVDFAEMEAKAIKKFSHEFIGQIKNLNNIDPARVINRLALSRKEEEEILNTLKNEYELSENDLEAILFGAHVRLEDGGAFNRY